MAKRKSKPIRAEIRYLRQRRRADGAWRVWWEPQGDARAAGFQNEDLSDLTPAGAAARAMQLNDQADAAVEAGGIADAPARGSSAATIKDLIQRYVQEELPAKRPATRRDYLKSFRLIEAKWGGDRVDAFTKPIMRQWYETLRREAGEHQAVALMRKMSLLFSYGELVGYRREDSNPCRALKMTTPKPRARVASWAEIGALMDAAETMGLPSMACAIALSALNSQRQADVIDARAGEFEHAGVWSLVRSKRGNLGHLLLHPISAEYVARMQSVEPKPIGDARLVRCERTGRPYGEDHFRHVFDEVRAAAAKHLPAVADLQFRDLRRTCSHLARLGGASKDDVGGALGNSAATDPRLEATYMPAADEIYARVIEAIVPPKGWRKGQ